MNILFFLKPKHEVNTLKKDNTVRQAIEKLRGCGYTAVPVLDDEGRYAGSVTEGDLLYAVADSQTPRDWEKVSIFEIMSQTRSAPVRVGADIADLWHLALTQNFVPVVDDRDAFIGIVTRQDIMRYFIKEET